MVHMSTLSEQKRRSALKLSREVADKRRAHERELENSGATSLRAWRQYLRVTQKEAGRMLGVTTRGYQKWEEGGRQPAMLASALAYHRIMHTELLSMLWLEASERHVLRAAWDKRKLGDDHIANIVRDYLDKHREGQYPALMSNINALSPAGRHALVYALDTGKL